MKVITTTSALRRKAVSEIGAKELIAELHANPDIAYKVFRDKLAPVLKVSSVEKHFDIKAGSLDSAKKNLTQSSFKHSEKLANLFATIITELCQGAINEKSMADAG